MNDNEGGQPEYRLNELCHIIPKDDGDFISLDTFIKSCDAGVMLQEKVKDFY